MEILPCSRVGHVFRDEHPYDFGKKGSNNVFVKNNNRFVHTWMDEYTDFYYGTRPNAKSIEPGDLSVREHFKVYFYHPIFVDYFYSGKTSMQRFQMVPRDGLPSPIRSRARLSCLGTR